MNNYLLKPLTAAVMATALTGCLSSGSSSDGTGSMSLDVTDAPVDNLSEVVITFTGVTLQPADGERFRIDFEEPKTLKMLELTRGDSANLFSDEEVPAGDYSFLLLHVSDDKNATEMYVVEDSSTAQQPLTVPSNQGLRLVSGFTVPQGGSADFTVDFDMRKAIVKPVGQDAYKLRPALRIIDNTEVGSVSGEIGQTLWNDCAEVTDYAGLVYLYEGHDRTPVDFFLNEDGTDAREEQPLIAGDVVSEGSDPYNYKISFLEEGNYTIAYSCDIDDTDADDTDTMTFVATRNITIDPSATQPQEEDLLEK